MNKAETLQHKTITTEFGFEVALDLMKQGLYVTRKAWIDAGIKIRAQFPDENSMNTEPYIIMEKRGKVFPLDLSCEAIFATDWVELGD